jgi:hypothetical protein
VEQLMEGILDLGAWAIQTARNRILRKLKGKAAERGLRPGGSYSFSFGMKFRAAELMQWRMPVGRGPSVFTSSPRTSKLQSVGTFLYFRFQLGVSSRLCLLLRGERAPAEDQFGSLGSVLIFPKLQLVCPLRPYPQSYGFTCPNARRAGTLCYASQ